MSAILTSVPICRVRYIRTINNRNISTANVTASPTVSYLTIPGQHGYVDLVAVTSAIDPNDPRVGYLDLVVTDDPDVLESFGWTIRFDGSDRPTRVVAVPQSGAAVTNIVTADGDTVPAVWLDQLATFTGPSGATGSDLATRTYVDDSLDAHEAASDPHPGYALDSDVAAIRQVPSGGSTGQVVTKTAGGYGWSAGGGGSPTGGAGGVLGGTYPNPSFAVDMATQSELDTVDAAKTAKAANLSDLVSPSTARTNLGVGYGTTAGTVAQGNDSRLSDARPWSLYTTATAPTTGQVPTWNGTAYAPTTPSSSGGVTNARAVALALIL